MLVKLGGPATKNSIVIWLVAVLVVLSGSSVLYYVEPKFPVAVLMVYIVEVFLYANLFIYSIKLKNATTSEGRKIEDLFQIESDA